jgi:glycosyltransferase involved in cell wall biosynthesis
MSEPRVLVLHNRYRVLGGEERALELHLEALARAGVEHRALLRESAAAGRGRAAAAMLRGGHRPDEVAHAVRDLGATVVHVHNMQPLFGPRSLAAARAAGARVVLHLHNFRLFCAIGVSFRDGQPCFRCHHGRTVPGLVLNCRGSLPEAAVYANGLSRQLAQVLDAVDRFVAPSRYGAGQLARLGVPAERLEPLPHYLPEQSIAAESHAHEGTFALVVGRLSAEKGVETAIHAAARAGVPLKVAGHGPLAGELAERARGSAAQVELLGRVSPDRLAQLRREAAVVLVPSRSGESFGLSALEAMGAGVPVVATRAGALPELVGDERCVPPGDAAAMAERLRELWVNPPRRRREGEELIARVRERFGRERFTRDLLDLYARLTP